MPCRDHMRPRLRAAPAGVMLQSEVALIPAPDIASVREGLSEAFRYRYDDAAGRIRLVGLLFAPATAPLTRDDLLPRLDEYHTRSADNMDLFWAGYGRYWGPLSPEDTKSVTGHDPPWLYSQSLFESFRQQMEAETKWRYSGEVDLLLMNTRYDEERRAAQLQLTDVVALDLARAKADGAISSVAVLLQGLFRYAESQDGRDPAWGYAGRQVGRNVTEGLTHAVLSALPADLGVLWKKGRHFRTC
jgi:hypothetical protein